MTEVFVNGRTLYEARDSILNQRHHICNLTYVNTPIYLYQLNIIKENVFPRSSYCLNDKEIKIRTRAADNHARIYQIYEENNS